MCRIIRKQSWQNRLCSFLVIWSIWCSKVSCTDLVRNPAERLFESELAAELLLFRIVDLGPETG